MFIKWLQLSTRYQADGDNSPVNFTQEDLNKHTGAVRNEERAKADARVKSIEESHKTETEALKAQIKELTTKHGAAEARLKEYEPLKSENDSLKKQIADQALEAGLRDIKVKPSELSRVRHLITAEKLLEKDGQPIELKDAAETIKKALPWAFDGDNPSGGIAVNSHRSTEGGVKKMTGLGRKG